MSLKTKLINPNYKNDYIENLFKNRGIDDINKYLTPSDDCIQSPEYLTNIDKAAKILNDCINGNKKIWTLVDSDVDGLTSCTIIYNYLKRLNPNIEIEYAMHEGKQHGIEDYIDELIEKQDEYSLIIIADASSNDGCYFKKLNLPVIVLDHHEVEITSEFPPNLIVVNNQSSPEYKNKFLSGAGVVLQFCRYIDMINNTNFSDDYYDLAALGIISDMMDITNYENRYIIYKGLNNIKNYFFQQLCIKQSFSMKSKANPMTVAFYITPMLNSCIRSGTAKEKDDMFRAFIDGHQMVITEKRGHKGEFVPIALEAVRECANTKNRQTREIDKAMALLESKIIKEGKLKNKILTIALEDSFDFSTTLNGLLAMKLATKYKKPTILGRVNSEGEFKGSARGLSNCPIESFKNFLESSTYFSCQGHANAFGYTCLQSNIEDFHKWANEELKDVSFDTDYFLVNFSRDAWDEDLKDLIYDLSQYEDLYGQGNPTPVIEVDNIVIDKSEIKVCGSNKNVINFVCNGITYVEFFANETISKLQSLPNKVYIHLVGKANINTFNSIGTPQIIIDAIDFNSVESMF